MKHFLRNNLNIASNTRLVIAGLVILPALFTVLLNAMPQATPRAYATNVDHGKMLCKQKIVEGSTDKPEDVPDDFPRYKECWTGFQAGFKNPNDNNPNNYCHVFGAGSSGWCSIGFRLGQDHKKSSSSQPSSGEVKRAAESACKVYLEQDNVSKENRQKNYNGCVAGYTGQYAGKNIEDACRSYSGPSMKACIKGHDAAVLAQRNQPNTINPDSGGGSLTGAAEESSESSVTEPGLECNVTFNPLTWLLCPAVKGMVSIVGRVDDTITSQLSAGSPGQGDDPNQIFCSSGSEATLKTRDGEKIKSCDAYKDAWKSVRNIALGLIVIAGLLVLIAQALGIEVLDAYTIRKTLPRILFAAIAITLSWEIMQFFVRLSNDLGFGIRYLIYAPFGGIENPNLAGGGLAATNLVAGGAIVALGIFGLLSFAATAALAVFIAFIVLVLREMLIIVLVILAPIALVAYILPNTQKTYKLWWDSFSKALLMFPIIAAFIAAGRVFATVASSSTSALGDLIGFAAYFAPYFMLPLTFRFAGTALGTMAGFVNDRGKGGFKYLQAYRGNQAKKNWEITQQNRRFNPHRRGALGYVNRKANSALSTVASPSASAKIYGGMAINSAAKRLGSDYRTAMGQGILNQINQTKFQHTQKLGEKLNSLGFNDRALGALMEMDGYSSSAINAKISELRASSNSNDHLAADQLASNAMFLAQGLNQDPEMGRADIGMAAGLAVTAQGFSDINSVVDLANRRGGSRDGLASAFVTQAQLNGQRAGRLDMKPGYGVQTGLEDGKFSAMAFAMKKDAVTGELVLDEDKMAQLDAGEAARIEANQIKRIFSSGQQDFQGAKAPSVTQIAPALRKILSTQPDANGDRALQFIDENGQNQVLKFGEAEVKRVAAMLGTAQGDYAGTSASTHAEIEKIIRSSTMSDETRRAYENARRVNPEDIERSRSGQQPPQEENK